MRTSTLVQGNADIITIVSLRAGDVYKRLEKPTYGEKYELRFGVVRDVMHNGEDSAITALEFTADYTGVAPALKVFGTDSDLRLFAAEPEEIRSHFAEMVKAAEDAAAKASEELDRKRAILEQVRRVASEESARALTAAATQKAVVA